MAGLKELSAAVFFFFFLTGENAMDISEMLEVAFGEQRL
jgi:hypothetical protein